jgi:putative peptidoglycan lipid II flippase
MARFAWQRSGAKMTGFAPAAPPGSRMNLLKTLATVSSMTLLSRILGFVRDFVIARTFGAGMLTDAFFVAFKLPNLLRRLFAEGAFSQAFVPVLGEYRNQRGPEETRQLVDRVSQPAVSGRPGRHPARHGRRAAAGLPLGTGLCRRPGQVRPDRQPDAHHLPLYSVHVAGRACRRRAQHLEPLCRTRFHAGTAQRLLHPAMALFAAPYFEPPIMALAWAVFIGGALQLAFQIPSAAAHRHAAKILDRTCRTRACDASFA